MNFLLRPTHISSVDQPSAHDVSTFVHDMQKPSATLEGLIAEDPYKKYPTGEVHNKETSGVGGADGGFEFLPARSDSVEENHFDVTEEEGRIIIPYMRLPEDWHRAPDVRSLCSTDRSFVFPGEQVLILACLKAKKQDPEIITPFKVAAVMSKNGMVQSSNKKNENTGNEKFSGAVEAETGISGQDSLKVDNGPVKENIHSQKDISSGESLLRMEDHKRLCEVLLHKFENSHFFVRIAESDEPLWSKRNAPEVSELSEMDGKQGIASDSLSPRTAKKTRSLDAAIDRGKFNANVSGGVARDAKCYALSNGDIVVLLQVNIGVAFLKEPVLEILQFEKFQDSCLSSEDQDKFINANPDPCGQLLKWLLPIDNSISPPARSLSPPRFSSSAGGGNASLKPTFSASSSSQLFSFSNFRSYSMSSIPQNTAPAPAPVTTSSSKPNFDLDDWDNFPSHNLAKSRKTGGENLLSFRGIPLEPERFSVRCGLEGIYIPARRWRRKFEIIQPVEIQSFAADCNTDELLCVQIKNTSPPDVSDIVIFLDAISIVLEAASKDGQPRSFPITCIEAGNDHSLPNLALRRGEEHSLILKLAPSTWRNQKAGGERISQASQLQAGTSGTNLHLSSKTAEAGRSYATMDQYAVLLSCRCNYTESRLFFKQPTSWQPRVSRDLLISVASEMSKQSIGSDGRLSQLPVQVLTLQASNLTSEDLTLTVLAPASFTSPPSVVSLNSSPSSPMSSLVGFSEFTGKLNSAKRGNLMQRLHSEPIIPENLKRNGDGGARSVSFKEQAYPISDVIPSAALACSHLWLQSRVPLGTVPAQSTATMRLDLLPLTDGIVTLDTLQIEVKEKGLTYIPELSLKINATCSISTGIL